MDPTTGLLVWPSTSKKDGGCNFCTRHDYFTDYKVYMVTSDDPHRNLTVRLCGDCLMDLKKYTRQVLKR